jgi:hypothetical protein
MRQTDVVEGERVQIPQYSINQKLQSTLDANAAKLREERKQNLRTGTKAPSLIKEQALTKFFAEYNPENVAHAGSILSHYENGHSVLVNKLQKKYGASPLEPRFDVPSLNASALKASRFHATPARATTQQQQQNILAFTQQIDQLSHGLFPRCEGDAPTNIVFVVQSCNELGFRHIPSVVYMQIKAYMQTLPPQSSVNLIAFPPTTPMRPGMSSVQVCSSCREFGQAHAQRLHDLETPDRLTYEGSETHLKEALRNAYAMLNKGSSSKGSSSAAVFLVLVGSRETGEEEAEHSRQSKFSFSLAVPIETLRTIPLHTIALDAPRRSQECFKKMATVTRGSVRIGTPVPWIDESAHTPISQNPTRHSTNTSH